MGFKDWLAKGETLADELPAEPEPLTLVVVQWSVGTLPTTTYECREVVFTERCIHLYGIHGTTTRRVIPLDEKVRFIDVDVVHEARRFYAI